MQGPWTSPLGEAGPAPVGDSLEFEVECRTARTGRGTRHPVTIAPDWSVTTPHELEDERIAQAFGGYLSCLDLVDVVVPAARELVQLLARRRLPDLALMGPGRWRSRGRVADCDCARSFFDGTEAAFTHEVGIDHWVRRTGSAPDSALLTVIDAVATAYGGFDRPPAAALEATRPLVREPWGVAELWRAGVPPEFVREVHRVVSPSGDPLPQRLYEAAAFARPDHDWLADLLTKTQDPDVVVWASWIQADTQVKLANPEGIMEWVELGLPREDVFSLVKAGCSRSQAADISARSSLSIRGAARQLAAWQRAGCNPGPGDLAALDQVGAIDWFTPRKGAIDALNHLSASVRPRPTRTQAALVLAVAGTTAEAMVLLKKGVRDPLAAANALNR